MRLKYRIQTIRQFISFAFYPKTTLIACTVFSVIVIGILAAVMAAVPVDSIAHNIVFALTTGAIGSFFVSIIVEMSSNYRNNKLAWHEIQDYYSVVTDYEGHKQVLLRNTPSQRAAKKAKDEFIDEVFKSDRSTEISEDLIEELRDIAEERSMDIVEATWKQLPKIIPVLKETLEQKKAYLTDEEILELRIISDNYKQIRHEVMDALKISPMFYDILNRPDEGFLNYPKNILDDMPDWVRKQLASKEGEEALDRLTDAVMADDVLLSMFMSGYDISLHGIETYHSGFEDEDESDEQDQNIEKISEDAEGEPEEDEKDDEDDAYVFFEPDELEEHRNYHIKMDRYFAEENKPFVSWLISRSCMEIANSIENLERNILKKPYYSLHLRFDRDAYKQRLDDPLTNISYESEKRRMEGLLKR